MLFYFIEGKNVKKNMDWAICLNPKSALKKTSRRDKILAKKSQLHNTNFHVKIK